KNAYLEAQKTTETAKIGVEMAVMSLLQTIGQDTRGSITRDDALDWAKVLADGYHVKVEPWQIDFDQAYDHMLLHRPEINQLKYQETLAQIALDEVRNDRDWSIKLSGQYVLDETVLQSSIDSDKTWISTAARSKMSDMPDFLGADPAGGVGSGTGNTDASSGLEIDDPWQVELSASYSFGDGGRKKADLLAKEAALEKASLRRAVAEDGFYLELNGAVKELKQLWQAYLLAQEGKRAADETLKQLELMHELGSLTSKEVREGQLMVAQAENLVLDAGLNYNGQKTKIWAMVGIDSEIMLHAVAGENWDILKQGADS
ncbi:MAG: TolC family protein, partial [Firmicutes bacterium]|nr:TolC family protein [Bacillota bacterium]